MLVLKNSVCVKAPVEKVWKYLAAIENVDLWVPAIKHAHCEGENARGLGAVRICKLDNFEVREDFVEWDEGRGFKYIAKGAPMLLSASNSWRIEPVGDQTLISSRTEIIVKGGVFGRLLEPLIYLATRFGFPNALAPLKYYIETGKPFTGKATDLPKALSYC